MWWSRFRARFDGGFGGFLPFWLVGFWFRVGFCLSIVYKILKQNNLLKTRAVKKYKLTSFHCELNMSFRSGFVKHKCQSGQKLKRKNWRLKMVNHTSNMNLIYSPYLLLAIPLLNFWNEGLLSAKIDGFLSGISISLSNATLQANNVDCFDSEICQLPCPWCEIFWANMNHLNVVFQKNPPNHHWFWVQLFYLVDFCSQKVR